MKFWNKIKEFFDDKRDINFEDILPTKNDFDLDIPSNRIIENYDPKKKNIIIIDDSRGIVSVVEDFLKEVERNGDVNLSEYNLLSFYDKYAPFVLEKTLNIINPEKIDFAIIDIVLPGKLKVDGKNVRFDGVDVSILLNKKYGCKNFCFFTGNVVSEHVEYIKDKIEKFNEHFGEDIQKFIIFKGDNDGVETVMKFKSLLKKRKYKL